MNTIIVSPASILTFSGHIKRGADGGLRYDNHHSILVPDLDGVSEYATLLAAGSHLGGSGLVEAYDQGHWEIRCWNLDATIGPHGHDIYGHMWSDEILPNHKSYKVSLFTDFAVITGNIKLTGNSQLKNGWGHCPFRGNGFWTLEPQTTLDTLCCPPGWTTR